MIARDTVRKATNRVKHKLPEALSNAVMVFESKTQPNSLVVLTEFQDESGRSVVVAIHLSKQQQQHVIKEITSVHGRSSDAYIVNWVKAGLARYSHTAKTPAWFRSRGLQLPKEGTLPGPGNRLITERDI
ncbi:MAG: hypothetical protein ACREXR_06735, partial [Gammaproteobacteria bacterium]